MFILCYALLLIASLPNTKDYQWLTKIINYCQNIYKLYRQIIFCELSIKKNWNPIKVIDTVVISFSECQTFYSHQCISLLAILIVEV